VGGDPIANQDPYGLYVCGPGVQCDNFSPPTIAALTCFDVCIGADAVITSGQDGHKKSDPHSRGKACDIGGNSNPGLGRKKAEHCFTECFPDYSYGQQEKNSPKYGGFHYHFQTTPGVGNATGFAPGLMPHGSGEGGGAPSAPGS
jgi:hypothetical protein